ncbi:hypothetical protein [uncultured Mycolicibacterium sp.]|uniref:hypothetical protein n=1 Tax=uncultured Mycolicibacterium sp. TaxID=2320817 RepID=UPI002610979F|nr:hypothetical protein [uncultured Mycolicibacterium sp.]
MNAVDERRTLSEQAAERGWNRREDDRVDIYTRGAHRIRVIWQGPDKISGSSYYNDDVLTTYTRDLNQVLGWLKR